MKPDIDAIRGRVEKATPGPCEWMGNGRHDLYLATTHSGRKYVMGFKRRGMQGAEPLFQENEQFIPASDMLKFDVGDGKARGITEGRADASVYRYDVATVDHPDAQLIAHAFEDIPALLSHIDELEALLRVVQCEIEELETTLVCERRT